jgi:hypothetical protein
MPQPFKFIILCLVSIVCCIGADVVSTTNDVINQGKKENLFQEGIINSKSEIRLDPLYLIHSLFDVITGIFKDVSLIKPIRSQQKTLNWCISFGDGAVYEANTNFITSMSANNGFDVIINYRKRHIDQEFYQKNKEILDQPRGAGYWLWKPYIILKTLQKMDEGDFLFYQDSGLVLLNTPFPYIELINNSGLDILLLKNAHTNRQYIKKEAFLFMEMDEKYRDFIQLDASFIVIKNTERSRKFIQQWLEYCQYKNIITDKKAEQEEYPDMIDHRHDQAILTLTYYKKPEGILLVDKGDDILHHRRRTMDIPLSSYVKQRLQTSINKHP